MENKKFNLKEKACWDGSAPRDDDILHHSYFEYEDIKEFIRLLKNLCYDDSGKGDMVLSDAFNEIDKLSGGL